MISKDNRKSERYFVGIDIGSTTVKIVASIPKTGGIVYSDYRRHGARKGFEKAIQSFTIPLMLGKVC